MATCAVIETAGLEHKIINMIVLDPGDMEVFSAFYTSMFPTQRLAWQVDLQANIISAYGPYATVWIDWVLGPEGWYNPFIDPSTTWLVSPEPEPPAEEM